MVHSGNDTIHQPFGIKFAILLDSSKLKSVTYSIPTTCSPSTRVPIVIYKRTVNSKPITVALSVLLVCSLQHMFQSLFLRPANSKPIPVALYELIVYPTLIR